MEEIERIEKDIILFEENMEKVKRCKFDEQLEKIIELAEQYYEDAKYYLKKGDHFTSFGCINYAHGLLDTLRKFSNEHV